MHLRTNPVKAALRAGGIVFGSEVSRFRSPEVVSAYAAAGFEFVFIDMEHTPFSLETVAEMIRAARASGIVPLVRVPQAEYSLVARVLDQGAQGIIVPRVNTPREVRDIVSWTRYPPRGIRGYASTPAQTDGRSVEPAEFIECNHSQTLTVVQIERREAVENLDEMLSIEGVDVACLGYMDLSVDLEVPGDLEHPSMVRAVERLVEAGRRHGVAPGLIHPDLEAVEGWIRRGMRFVSFASDAIHLERAARSAVESLRGIRENLGAPARPDRGKG